MTLREMREAAGLTQEAAAAKAGVRQGVISQFELGKVANPTLTTLEAFARAYDVSLEDVAAAVRESIEAVA